jgi:diaminopimelate epimerase
VRFVKGHGTGNDFVLLPDLPAAALTPDLVRALCDRHAGIGADGVLRVEQDAGGWFMDYRNADGSVAEMCGNGVRVFARYLVDARLAGPGTFTVGSRGGPKRVTVPPAGEVSVDMGPPWLGQPAATVAGAAAVGVNMGNPHLVVPVGSDAELAALDLTGPPAVSPAPPDGANVEFVVRRGPRLLGMRVYERGVGETRSCGTGVCAAVVATVHAAGGAGRGEPWTVQVPGGRLLVTWSDTVTLTGPAVLVAAGEVLLDGQRLQVG